jgi:MFS family permease
MVSAVYYWIVTVSGSLPPVAGGHQPWRYMLISGLVPAIPLLIVRPWLPESPVWLARRATGLLRRPRVGELFQPRFRQTTIATTVMVTCGYAASFGANLQVPRIVADLPEVRAMSSTSREQTVGTVQWLQELGGLAGRVALAALAVRIARRRWLIRMFIAPAIVLMPIVFFGATHYGVRALEIGTFFAGFFTVGQFSFWGNYLPRVYPTHLRGTGESFAANIGGRMLGSGAAVVTTAMAPLMPATSTYLQLAHAAGIVGVTSFVIALVSSRWLPEPRSAELPV